ncbi:DNA internalization-related competence protein ComEC/Rec2 [Glaesserella sp.]|uniref:DNA internalization-related competence protein ComEC/Rec2 n=1 Tax=Glaesserella sp. TaxID=2094731 RepID=UPI0035A0BF7F
MNLDRFCQSIVLLLLPILCLPGEWLIYAIIGAVLLGIFGIVRRDSLCSALGIIIGLSYAYIFHLYQVLDNVVAEKVVDNITVTQILKQQEYQSAIAERSNGRRIYLTWQSDTPLILHAQYRAELNIRPISGRLNQGNFDRQRWYVAQHIEQLASVKRAERVELKGTEPQRTRWLYFVKDQTERLASQGLLLALAFGERAWLPASHWTLFQQTTTAHLIAISGLHIGFAFLFGFWFAKLLHWIALRFRLIQAVGFAHYFANTLGWIFAAGYSFLAGFAIPTVRTLIAISLVLLCRFLRRHYTPWQLWWRGVALLLILDPTTLLSDSFWLSVLAVASLIFWYRFFPFHQWIRFDFCKKFGVTDRLLLPLIHLQLGIWLVFTPVQLWFFGGSSLLALPANLLIVPLYSLVLVPIILISLLTNNVFQTWQLADWLIQWSLALLEPLAPYWIDLSSQQQWQLLTINVLVLTCLYLKLNHKPWRYWGYAVIVFLLCNRAYAAVRLFSPPPLVEWVNFDVGQGLAMALVYQTSGQKRAVFYDTGASWVGGSMADMEILPYLKREGIEVEAIFISHDDNDHAGGTKALLTHYPQAKLMLSGQNSDNHHAFEPCVAGKWWQFGEIEVRAVYPNQTVPHAKNEDSCVLLVEIGQSRVLFTGDSGVAEERQYARQIGTIDFLQVGHHGSQTSTSQTLLAHTRPNYAMISAGRWNPWKHPNRQVVERLLNYDSTVLNTAQVGMIKVAFYRDHYRITTARDKWSSWYSEYLGR